MNQNINVDLIPKFAVYGNLYFSQYDVGREAIINLVNGSTEYEIPSGATVTLVATKPSGLGFTQNCTFEGNQITVVCTAEMTDESGHFPCEIRIANGSLLLGTANFVFNVEKSPHPEGTTDGTADSVINQITIALNTALEEIERAENEAMANISGGGTGLTPAFKEALLDCFANVAWINGDGQQYYDALESALYAVTAISVSPNSLVFDELNQSKQLTATLIPVGATGEVAWSSSNPNIAVVSSEGLVTAVDYGEVTITASINGLSASVSVVVSEVTVTSISAILDATGHTFYVGDNINDIKNYLTVTAHWNDGTDTTVSSNDYSLSGALSEVGANTITISYGSKSTTVSVTAVGLSNISAIYTQSGYVYVNDSLNSLKPDLVVTANYSDGTSETVSDYTLSGTLVTGTSTITVVYGSKTTTFTVNVVSLSSIDAVYTQSGVVSDSASLDSLKTDLVVTATLSNGDIYTVPSTDYTLSGTLEGGTSVITVTYQGLTDTFNVTVTEIIDYTLNPLENVTWYDGYSYNNTGVMSAAAGEHCTSKFTVQNCAYMFTNGDTTNNRYPAIFAWDENGSYLGRIQIANLYMLKKGYTYAVKAYNAGTFDSSTITLMPKDNSSTAVAPFQIDLGANIASITASGTSHYELNVSSIMSSAGVTAQNMATKLNKCNYMALLYPATKSFFDNADFTFCWYNINTLQFKVKDVGVNLDNLATYLASNNIVIRFND